MKDLREKKTPYEHRPWSYHLENARKMSNNV